VETAGSGSVRCPGDRSPPKRPPLVGSGCRRALGCAAGCLWGDDYPVYPRQDLVPVHDDDHHDNDDDDDHHHDDDHDHDDSTGRPG